MSYKISGHMTWESLRTRSKSRYGSVTLFAVSQDDLDGGAQGWKVTKVGRAVRELSLARVYVSISVT
jgi:hypothetical protein